MTEKVDLIVYVNVDDSGCGILYDILRKLMCVCGQFYEWESVRRKVCTH